MQKLNILLVIPRYRTYSKSNHYVMPLGILYISSYLKQAQVANVRTVNLNHKEGEEENILSDLIGQHHTDILGIGGLSGEYQDIARIIKLAKKINPSIKTIVGGGIMTADPVTAMHSMPEIDYGIIGEGEITLVELITARQPHRRNYFSRIRSIYNHSVPKRNNRPRQVAVSRLRRI